MIATTLIEIPSWGPASLIEVIWLISGVVAIAFSTPGIRKTLALRRTAIRENDQVMLEIAGGYVERTSVYTFMAAIITAIGAYGCWIGQPRPGPVVTSPVGLVLTCGLLALGLCIAYLAASDRARQYRQTNLLDESLQDQNTRR